VIVGVAVVPHPPLLVPELVAGAVAETEAVRRACVAAGKRLAALSRDWLAIAGDSRFCGLTSADAVGSFRGYGVDKIVSLAEDAAVDQVDPGLPLPVLVAGWLREQAGAARVVVETIDPAGSVNDSQRVGERLARQDRPVGLLVLGDGSSRHPGPAGHPDERSVGYDSCVRAALASADVDALLGLDVELAAELDVSGRAAWQALAGAAAGRSWRAELVYSEAPFGVGYHVACWEPA
jgi:aromatic ring-opening dioxygenase LigB subunit